MNRIQQAIDEIAARNENEPDMLKELKVLEDHIYEIESKMKSLFKDVCVDQKTKRNEAQFTVAYKHYGTVCMIAGNLIKMGFQDVQIHHYNNVDISAYIEDSTGKRTTIGIEVEMPGTARACSIVGFSIEDMKEIEVEK